MTRVKDGKKCPPRNSANSLRYKTTQHHFVAKVDGIGLAPLRNSMIMKLCYRQHPPSIGNPSKPTMKLDAQNLHVIYEDNHLLVLNKPANIVTQGAELGKPSLLGVAKDYIKWKYNKPGNVFLGVVSRLDTRVTGVIVFARTSKAASRLSEQFRNRTTEKRYWALVEQAVSPAAGEWTEYIRKEDEGFKVRVLRQPDARSKLAKLQYETKFVADAGCLLEIQLLTGRKHQIRAQLAAHGRPILGDKKYGSRCAFPNGIALHSRRLLIQHPTQNKTLEFVAPTPLAWKNFGVPELDA